MTSYALLKFVHVLLAVVAVGFNASYGIWLARAAREPQHLGHVLHGIKVLDDRFANPAYVLLLLTGLTLTFIGGIPLATAWIAASLALYVVLVIVALGVYTPTLRAQLRLLEAQGATSPEYARVARRGTVVGIVLAVVVVAIVFLMVTKPTF